MVLFIARCGWERGGEARRRCKRLRSRLCRIFVSGGDGSLSMLGILSLCAYCGLVLPSTILTNFYYSP